MEFRRPWLLLLSGAFFLAITIGILWPSQYHEYLLRSLKGPIAPDDEELLAYIKEKILIPPSDKPYNLDERKSANHKPRDFLFYMKNVKKLFNNKFSGIFVEAGALDGQTLSNTLWLEMHRGWTGLLVEPDELSFKALQEKHRKAWLANVCLSRSPYPKEELFISYTTDDMLIDAVNRYMVKATNVLASVVKEHDDNERMLYFKHLHTYFSKVQCVPLETLLLARGIQRVDLMVIDVEGSEEEILEKFDFSKFDVEVLFLESYQRREVVSLMSNRGYTILDENIFNFVFVKNGSSLIL